MSIVAILSLPRILRRGLGCFACRPRLFGYVLKQNQLRYNTTPTTTLPYPVPSSSTGVSYTSPPRTTTSDSVGALFNDVKHVLDVDLGVAEAACRKPHVDAAELASLRPLFLDRLRAIASRDKETHADGRIDYVRFSPTNAMDEPSRETYLALDGISPKHLHIESGRDEICNLRHLDSFHRQWTSLQSLHLENVTSNLDSRQDFPSVTAHLRSLTLQYCADIHFLPPGGVLNLERLKIVNNNALDMFMFAFDGNPGLKETLEIFDITSTNGTDLTHRYYSEDFQERLKQCTHIRELSLSLAHDGLDTGLAPSIPDSVEVLTFRPSCTPPMFADLDVWIERMKDPTWLPRLRAISMPFGSLPGHYHDVAPSELADFEAKRKTFFDLLQERRPNIHLKF